MKNMFRKLNFKRGASIALAMLIFFLCALAGVTALTMSMANVGRFSHAQEDQQPYYTVSSAALLMIDLLDGMEYTSPLVEYDSIREWKHVSSEEGISGHPSREYNTLNLLKMDATLYNSAGDTGETKRDHYLKSVADWQKDKDKQSSISIYNIDAEGKEKEDSKNPLLPNSTNTLRLLTKLQEYCDSLVPYCVVPQEWYSSLKFSYTTTDEAGTKKTEEYDPELQVADFLPDPLDYSFTISTDTLSPVSARLVMQDSYHLILSFSCRESFGSDKTEYALYAINVYWTATVDTTTKSDPAIFSYTENGDMGSMTSKQTKRVTVRWDKANVTISRGEANETT